jgi:hypothetical protein
VSQDEFERGVAIQEETTAVVCDCADADLDWRRSSTNLDVTSERPSDVSESEERDVDMRHLVIEEAGESSIPEA